MQKILELANKRGFDRGPMLATRGLDARRFWNRRITAAHVKDPCTPHRALLLSVRQGAEEAACQILGSANQKPVFRPGRYTKIQLEVAAQSLTFDRIYLQDALISLIFHL